MRHRKARAAGVLVGALLLLAAAPVAASGAGLRRAASLRRYAVGKIVVVYTDRSRSIRLPGHPPIPRTLVTVIRYPAEGTKTSNDVTGAPPAARSGPFPLVVFAHGFDVTPAPYARLLQAWASAGYVVAAPTFPLTRPRAPGGPDESDLVNQPADMSFVITRLLQGSGADRGILAGLIDGRAIAVAGQSDGGSTALATAYNDHFRDRRLGAAVVLSGAEIPGLGGYGFRPGEPPLLAVQGTADTSNAPSSTYRYFGLAAAPKFLLTLLGAPHLGPYTDQQPYLGIVERTSIAFLDRYLEHRPGARLRLWGAAQVPGIATLTSR
jgi:dienelactone hydrolase